jgi:bacterioferritin (cytochrome b1)
MRERTESGEVLVPLLERWIDLEKKSQKALLSSEKKAENPLVRLVLREILLDTIKHLELLKGILDLTRKPALVTREEVDPIRRVLEEHLRGEEVVIEEAVKVLEKMEEVGVKPLLLHILADERKHHAILERLVRRPTSFWVDYGEER